MKTIWNVEIKLMNGSVTLLTDTKSFSNKELADKTANVLKEANKQYSCIVRVYESELYENENEVPTLNL